MENIEIGDIVDYRGKERIVHGVPGTPQYDECNFCDEENGITLVDKSDSRGFYWVYRSEIKLIKKKIAKLKKTKKLTRRPNERP